MVREEAIRVKLLDAKKAATEARMVTKELEHMTGVSGKSTKASSESANQHTSLLKKVGGGIFSAAGLSSSLLGVGAIGYAVDKLSKSGIASQQSQILLKQSLQQTGNTGKKAYSEIDKAIQESSSHGGFAPIEEREGVQALVRQTKNYKTAIVESNSAVTLARGLHESYSLAISQVEKVQYGATGRMQKFLGILQPVKYYMEQLTGSEKKRFPQKVKEAELLDKEATAREANRRILERYGGAVTAYNKSTAGAIFNANNAFKQATEQLGEKLLPAETAVAKWFGKIVVEISKGEGVWHTVGKDIEGVWSALEKVYHFLEGHKDLAKALGYGGAALGAASLAKKVPGVGMAAKVLKYIPGGAAGAEDAGAATAASGGLPAAVPFAIGGSIPFLSAAGIRSGTEAISPGYLKQYSKREVEQSYLGGQPGAPVATGKNTLGGRVAGGAITPAEAKQVTQILANPNLLTKGTKLSPEEIGMLQQAVERGMSSHVTEVHIDSEKVAKSLRNNANASRYVAEANTQHTQRQRARE